MKDPERPPNVRWALLSLSLAMLLPSLGASIANAALSTYLAAPKALVASAPEPDWHALAELPWITPGSGTCCGLAAEKLFQTHSIRPKRIVNVDRERVTRTLIAGGVGVGLLHADTAKEGEAQGELDLVCEAQQAVRALFAHPTDRAEDRLLGAVSSIVRSAHAS